MRKHRLVGGTHRDSTISAGAVKVGVLGVLATATIAAPLAAAAAGIDEAAPQGETIAQAQPAAPVAQAPAPVALPSADAAAEAAVETRTEDGDASRSEARTSPVSVETEKAAEQAEAAEKAPDTGIEVSVPEPVEEAEVAAPVGDDGYLRPVSGPITSGFGGRMHPVLGYFKGHDGVDFGSTCGTPVVSVKSGTVIAVEYNGASGKRVKVDHGNGVVTGYYHLQGYNTSVGATVGAGETIGYVGSTGRSTGCHLHFAKMDEAGNYSNPMSILR